MNADYYFASFFYFISTARYIVLDRVNSKDTLIVFIVIEDFNLEHNVNNAHSFLIVFMMNYS